METRVREIRPNGAVIEEPRGRTESVPNDFVFTMIGREVPLDLFRCFVLPFATTELIS